MDLRYFAWLKAEADKKAEAERYAWVPACGGSEVPFECKGMLLLYMWNKISGEHAYYDVRGDVFLAKDAMEAILS